MGRRMLQLVTMRSRTVAMMLMPTMRKSVCCLPILSEMVPQVIDPITRDTVNTMVIRPIWAMLRFSCRLMKMGTAMVIIPLLMERSGRSKAIACVFFCLNSFFNIFRSGVFWLK